MFEKFSENARRVIFMARRHASVFGTENVTPELLLLGMLQENGQEVCRLIGCAAGVCEGLLKGTEEIIPRGNPVSLSEDMRVSKDLGRVFRYAVQEISGVSPETVQPKHLLIGILREEGCKAAELLRVNGAELKVVRQRVLNSQ